MTPPYRQQSPRSAIAITPDMVEIATTGYLPMVPYDTAPRELENPPQLQTNLLHRAWTAFWDPETAKAEALMRADHIDATATAYAESHAQRLEEMAFLGALDSWNRCAAAIDASDPRIQDFADNTLAPSMGRTRQSMAQNVNGYRMRSAHRHAR